MAMQRMMRIIDGNETRGFSGSNGIRVAFASSDMAHVNQHFGSAKTLVIYEVTPEGAQLLEVAEYCYVNHDENEGKLVEKIEFLKGCVAVYSQAVGSSAAQKLLTAGIQPVKVHDDAEIPALINHLQDEILQGPSTWLAQAIIRQKNPDMNRFDNMEVEGWDE